MKFIKWFNEISKKDVSLFGGKNSSLGELYRNLSNMGIKVPGGFAVSADAYKFFIKSTGLEEKIKNALKNLDKSDIKELRKKGKIARELILNSEIPEELKNEIGCAYKKLEEIYGKNVDVAVRSSATAEDLPTASFAGQYETFLNVRGEKNLIEAVLKCYSSLFTDRAISYREDHGFNHFDIFLSIGIQKMVRADKACSGVIFTIDPETGFKNTVYITGSWGLGELVVQGAVNPDAFYVFKPTLEKGYKAIIEKKLGEKNKMLVYGKEGIIEKDVPGHLTDKFILDDEEILLLARWAIEIEKHYKMPMDIEWAKDGISNDLFIVQARPETVHSARKSFYVYELDEKSDVIIEGEAIGNKIGRGRAKIVKSIEEMEDFKEGDVLVADMTDPDWEPIMKIASAIVTNRGGRTCHAAIVSRELGIPAVIGTKMATELIKDGEEITVDCSEGIGRVYRGLLKYEEKEINFDDIPETKTRIMMNVAIPEKAFLLSQIPNDGVGLARIEFIINSHIGIHPMALVEYEKLRTAREEKIREIVKEIEKRTSVYENKKEFYVEQLAMGIAKIASAFYPNDVIVRFSDFKTNEYAKLIGGNLYEPVENNPMIGWRGASRYYDEKFREAFGLECRAIKKCRDEMGLKNIKVMIPFCRTPEEGMKVLQTMESFGLKREDIEVYVMCEVPSNVILAEEFAKIFDGFSIGSNDLTQLTLGIDRDSDLISHLFDERNEAVKKMIESVIDTAKKYGRKIGICGQAPSDFPEFAKFLIDKGIDSISLNPDAVVKTKYVVAERER
ncbi:MAG TPA: phosphoenolpyruvate synthase [Thermoplasmatales archaeon]|nr:phosphoenolpyruvate synthase [Thermoplasmatales archaeon]